MEHNLNCLASEMREEIIKYKKDTRLEFLKNSEKEYTISWLEKHFFQWLLFSKGVSVENMIYHGKVYSKINLELLSNYSVIFDSHGKNNLIDISRLDDVRVHLSSESYISPGSVIEVDFNLPGLENKYQAIAMVMWSKYNPASMKFEVGLCFAHLYADGNHPVDDIILQFLFNELNINAVSA